MKIKLKKLQCNNCGHIWTPRKEEVRICPKCHSLRWDKNNKEKSNKKEE